MLINFVLEYFKFYLRVINVFFATPFEWERKTGLLILTKSRRRLLLYRIQKCGFMFYFFVIVKNTYNFLNSDTLDLSFKLFSLTMCTCYVVGSIVSLDFISNEVTVMKFFNGLIVFEREHLLSKF